MTEDDLQGIWIVDPVQGTRSAALQRHFDRHGAEMGAADEGQYVRQAVEFARRIRGRGRSVDGLTVGVRRWTLEGKYIDIAPSGEIVSFGRTE